MKVNVLWALIVFLWITSYLSANALEIEGGQIVDVVVADSGYSDTTFVIHLRDGWYPVGPKSFDVDKDGKICVLDQLGARVLKYKGLLHLSGQNS
jgi:hypothetical protein